MPRSPRSIGIGQQKALLWPYALVSILALLLCMAVGAFLVEHLDALVSNAFGDEAFFLLLLFFSLACATALFGFLRSAGTAKGQLYGVKFEFGGPAAIFVLIMLVGVFTFKDKQTDFPLILKLRTDNSQTMAAEFGKDAITSSSVTVDLGPDSRPVSFNSEATAFLPLIPFRMRSTPIAINLDSRELIFKEPKSTYLIPKGSDAVLTLVVIHKPKKVVQKVVKSTELSRITSGGTSDGHSPFCQPRTVRGCVTPQNGGKLIPDTGDVVGLVRNSNTRGTYKVSINKPEQICIDFTASTGACETEIFVQGYASATESFEEKN
jgi:hypothetical protein